jgi:hypothetical protein
MMRKKLSTLLFGILAAAIATTAWAGIPNLDNSSATVATAGATVVVCPAGDGDRLDTAQDCASGHVNATVTLTVYDINFDFVVGYPAADMWLEANGICLCTDGSIADGPTDVNGIATFSGALKAGGCSTDGSLNVYINPHGLLNQMGMSMDLISPDMTCDLVVNISDFSAFAGAYLGGYAKCADFVCDGVLNVSDLVYFANHYQHICP